MTMEIGPNPIVIDGVPPGIEGFAGSQLISAYAYPGYGTLTPFEDVNTQRIDWATFQDLDQDQVHDLSARLEQTALENGEELLATAVYKGVDVILGIPSEVCFLGFCWTPPFAGTALLTANHYRLWALTRPLYAPFVNPHARALGPLLVLAFGGVLIAVLLTIVGIQQMEQGRIKWSDLQNTVQDILGAPGENIAKPISAAFWPLAALGVAMVAAAIVFPIAMSKISVSAPIGPVRVGGEFAGGSAVQRAGGRGGRR